MLEADTLTPTPKGKVGMLVDVEVDSAEGLVYVSLLGPGIVLRPKRQQRAGHVLGMRGGGTDVAADRRVWSTSP